jgi:Spy/CpxP family protein refolding chaperone
MSRFYKIFMIMLISVFTANLAIAQDFAPEELHDRISTVKKMKLLEILNLDEDQTDKFIAKYSFWENKLKKSRHEMRKKAEELEKTLREDAGDAEIAKKSQELLELQKAHFKEMGQFHEAMQAVLDDKQFAKFQVFEIKFPAELKKLIKRHGRKGMGGSRERRNGW